MTRELDLATEPKRHPENMAGSAAASRDIARNAAIHDRMVRRYRAIHVEIYNDREQARLAAAVAAAKAAIKSGSRPLRALDFGSGLGNVVNHLVRAGMEVTAGDISHQCLDYVGRHFQGVELAELNGRDLSNFADNSFDLCTTYSVLHHIPDYVSAVRELGRVTRPGGVVMIDHEQSENCWSADPVREEFRAKALRFDWRKYLRPANYYHKFLQLFDPRHANEGDIHVWPDDHIEWVNIRKALEDLGFEPVIEENYLLYRSLYRREVFDQYEGRIADTKLLIMRKAAA